MGSSILDKRGYVNFIRAKNHTRFADGCKERTSGGDEKSGQLAGKEARSFYESLITVSSPLEQSPHKSETSAHKQTERSKQAQDNTRSRTHKFTPKNKLKRLSGIKTERQKTERHKYHKKPDRDKHLDNRLQNQFLRLAQDGNLVELRRLLKYDVVDINCCDQFGWNALMCAAHMGQHRVVKYLLKKGVYWKNVFNSKGQTAMDLASLAGQSDITQLFQTHEKGFAKKPSGTDMPSDQKYWCTVCQGEFTDDEKKHKSSTTHQFNCQHKPQRVHYYISEDNPGYRLMVKSGWDEEKGLGPEGSGRQYPVKTVLKQDRLGLGNEDLTKKARVTHFGPCDAASVKRKRVTKPTEKQITKKERLCKDRKDKMWERDMRIYMNTD